MTCYEQYVIFIGQCKIHYPRGTQCYISHWSTRWAISFNTFIEYYIKDYLRLIWYQINVSTAPDIFLPLSQSWQVNYNMCDNFTYFNYVCEWLSGLVGACCCMMCSAAELEQNRFHLKAKSTGTATLSQPRAVGAPCVLIVKFNKCWYSTTDLRFTSLTYNYNVNI